MDGCWNPLVLGCVVNWQAWAAIGSLAAALAAVGLGLWGHFDRKLRDRSQAAVVAGTLMAGLEKLIFDLKHVRKDQRMINRQDREWFDAQFLASAQVRADLATAISQRVHFLEIERAEDRLHVLPSSLSVPLVEIVNSVRRIQYLALQLQRNSRGEEPKTVPIDPRSMRLLLLQTQTKARRVSDGLLKLSGIER